MRLAKFGLTAIVSCFTLFAKADYRTIYFPELIESADLIVAGKIVKLKDDSYILKISSKLKGNHSDSLIVIEKFKDWTCAYRYAEYQVGQEQIVFVTKASDKYYQILGAGDEGEMPIVNKNVYYKVPFDTGKPGVAKHTFGDRTIFAYQFDFTSVSLAIQEISKNPAILSESSSSKNRNLKSSPVMKRIAEEYTRTRQ